MQSSRAGCTNALRNMCGAFAGMLIVAPARAVDVSPRNVTVDRAFENREHLFEIVTVRRRTAAWRDKHIDQAVAPGSVIARHEDRVRIAGE
jgi:hypothetical protein